MENNELKRFYIADGSTIMIGASWSIFTMNKIKLEYDYGLGGPQPQHAILIQSAFMF
ncbi:MAG: hypothetical protein HC906_09290 [Bacteroidales bacterium]|nr:hypothetical protein [Bacteroidales bacterium]